MTHRMLWGAILVMALIIWHQNTTLDHKQRRIEDLQLVVDTYEADQPAVSCAGWHTTTKGMRQPSLGAQ